MTPLARRTVLLTGLLALLPAAVHAQSRPDWIDALRQGGHVVVVRHGATFADQADTDPLNPKNVTAQRQLNDKGREQAKSMGDSMRKLGIPVSHVTTSVFQRAVETGQLLGFGEPTTTADVTEGGLVVSPNENNRRMQAMRKLAATAPPSGNVVIISHKPNILDAFGKDWFDVSEGEASIFKPDGSGGYKLIARVKADEWGKLAQLAAK